MKKLRNTVTRNVSPHVSYLVLITLVVVVGILCFVVVNRTFRASADEPVEPAEVQHTTTSNSQAGVDVEPFAFSQAAQFGVGQTKDIQNMSITFMSLTADPFEVLFELEDGHMMTFGSEGETQVVGDHVIKLSQIAPVASAHPSLLRAVLLVGEQ